MEVGFFSWVWHESIADCGIKLDRICKVASIMSNTLKAHGLNYMLSTQYRESYLYIWHPTVWPEDNYCQVICGQKPPDPRESQLVDSESHNSRLEWLITFLTAVRCGEVIYLKIQRLGSGNLPIYVRFLPILVQAKVNSIMWTAPQDQRKSVLSFYSIL